MDNDLARLNRLRKEPSILPFQDHVKVHEVPRQGKIFGPVGVEYPSATVSTGFARGY